MTKEETQKKPEKWLEIAKQQGHQVSCQCQRCIIARKALRDRDWKEYCDQKNPKTWAPDCEKVTWVDTEEGKLPYKQPLQLDLQLPPGKPYQKQTQQQQEHEPVIIYEYASSKVHPKTQLRHGSTAASGFDLWVDEPIVLQAGERKVYSTDLRLIIPKGFEGQIRSRSGTVAKLGLAVANAPGTVDSDYRGVIRIILHNIGPGLASLPAYSYVAQIVFAPVAIPHFRPGEIMRSGTVRAEKGFGSSDLQEQLRYTQQATLDYAMQVSDATLKGKAP